MENNDAFAKAVAVRCLPFSAQADLTRATVELGEPQGCGAVNRSVWYRFAPETRTDFAGDVTAAFDVTVAVYRGDKLDGLQLVTCDLALPRAAAPGQPYFIQVGTYQDTFGGLLDSGNLVANLALEPSGEFNPKVMRTFAGVALDGIPAVRARLNYAWGVGTDAQGNLYIADSNNNRVRRVDRSGVIATVAGNGVDAFAGDTGPAGDASLSGPQGVATDTDGNLYIADTFNSRIRKVDRRGVITTVAGNGEYRFSGDGGPATQAGLDPWAVAADTEGNLYIADFNNSRIRRVDRSGVITTVAGSVPGAFLAQHGPGTSLGDGGPATQASLNYPIGVVTDTAGNLYIADYGNSRVRKVDRSGVITTVAGNGDADFSGDGGPATQASLNYPTNVATDTAGNLYIADQFNHRIRKVDRSGVITTVAGNDMGKFGDGGPATQASLNYPTDVSTDPDGNLYIADYGNNRVRRVNRRGVIFTVAGQGLSPVRDGSLASRANLDVPRDVVADAQGNLYVSDTANNRVRRVDLRGVITTVAGNGDYRFSGDGGPATQASLDAPGGVALDTAGNLYIADQFNHRIRKVDRSGVITTVAGNGKGKFSGDGGPATQASLNYPTDVSTDPDGNLYIADYYNSRIRKVDRAGVITTVAGNGLGLASSAGFDELEGASICQQAEDVEALRSWCRTVESNESVAENIRRVKDGIREVGGTVSRTSALLGDGGPATLASLNYPIGVATDTDGNLYIADTFNNRVRRVDSRGVITTVAGNGDPDFSGDGGPATEASLYIPERMALDRDGNLYIVDTFNNRIRRVDTHGVITTVAGNGDFAFSGDYGPATQARLSSPRGVAVDVHHNLYIADTFNSRIRKVDRSGVITTVAGNFGAGFSGDGGPADQANLNFPRAIVQDREGNLYIADTGNDRVRRVDRSGVITTAAGTGASTYSGDGLKATQATVNAPSGVASDPDGNLYIADTGNNRVRRVDRRGVITTVAGNGDDGFSGDGSPATRASLAAPQGVAVDAQGNLYIADTGNNRVRRVDRSGVITTVAGDGVRAYSGDGLRAPQASLNAPSGVTLDTEGNLYIADTGNSRVRRTDPSGVISTVAGTGRYAFAGDGGPAIQASLAAPSGLAVDPDGNLFVADTGNNRVRRIDRSGVISTVAGNGAFGLAGEGVLATEASLTVPSDITIDTDGNAYVADAGVGVVRVIASLTARAPTIPTPVKANRAVSRHAAAPSAHRSWAGSLVPADPAVAAPGTGSGVRTNAGGLTASRPVWWLAALLALSVAAALARRTRGAGRLRKHRGPGSAEPL
jgi:sugar lactone lactonase YvrE